MKKSSVKTWKPESVKKKTSQNNGAQTTKSTMNKSKQRSLKKYRGQGR